MVACVSWRTLPAAEEPETILPFRNAMVAKNDPWVFAVPSMGFVFDVKDDWVLDLSNKAKVINTIT
jgi:hypothetical protein